MFMNINWTEKELKVIKDLSEKLELTEEQVIRQSLRIYQVVSEGLFRLEEVNPRPKMSSFHKESAHYEIKEDSEE